MQVDSLSTKGTIYELIHSSDFPLDVNISSWITKPMRAAVWFMWFTMIYFLVLQGTILLVFLLVCESFGFIFGLNWYHNSILVYSFFIFPSTPPTLIALYRVLPFWENLVSLLEKILKTRSSFYELRGTVFLSPRLGTHPYLENGEALEQNAQRNCGCPILGNVHCQAGCDLEPLL